jgi:hypothetical protein
MPTPSLTEAVRRGLPVRSQVTESAHGRGGVAFRLGRRELGMTVRERSTTAWISR